MAKNKTLDSAVKWTATGLGGYTVYQMGLQGKFGKDFQGWMINIRNAFKSGAGNVAGPAPVGSAAGTGTNPAVFNPAGVDGPNTSFIAGWRYVAPYGGGYIVVINGQQVGGVYGTQAEAEAAYNRALGA